MKPTKPCNTQNFKTARLTCVTVWHINRVRDVSDCKSALCCQQSAVLAVVVISNSMKLQYKRELGAKINHVTDRGIHSNGCSNLKMAAVSLSGDATDITLGYLHYIHICLGERISGSSTQYVLRCLGANCYIFSREECIRALLAT